MLTRARRQSAYSKRVDGSGRNAARSISSKSARRLLPYGQHGSHLEREIRVHLRRGFRSTFALGRARQSAPRSPSRISTSRVSITTGTFEVSRLRRLGAIPTTIHVPDSSNVGYSAPRATR